MQISLENFSNYEKLKIQNLLQEKTGRQVKLLKRDTGKFINRLDINRELTDNVRALVEYADILDFIDNIRITGDEIILIDNYYHSLVINGLDEVRNMRRMVRMYGFPVFDYTFIKRDEDEDKKKRIAKILLFDPIHVRTVDSVEDVIEQIR